MKVRALVDIARTIDGERLGPFAKDHEYELDDKLAKKWIESAMFEKVVEVIVKKETVALTTAGLEKKSAAPAAPPATDQKAGREADDSKAKPAAKADK